MERILEHFRLYTSVSDAAWKNFKSRLKLQSYRCGDIIHPIHEPAENMGFILKGFARSFLQKQDGKDFTWCFHYDDMNSSPKQFILVDYPSFTLQTPSMYGFQALNECQIAMISLQDLRQIFTDFPEFLVVEKHMVVRAYQHNNKRLESLLTKSALGRLNDFEQMHGYLYDKIPHYHIASYLGITPQRLCQLRSSENQKNS